MTMKSSSCREIIFLHGIRALAIILIVLGHTHTFYWQKPVINGNEFFNWIKQFSSMFILSGFMSVDTFFLMSAMLLTLSVFHELDKS